jgi:glycosyltransferase involved in cell wall biosynthesis
MFTGEYVTFVDSDDYVAEDYIERLYEMIASCGSQMSVICPQTFYEREAVSVDEFDPCKTVVFSCDAALSEMFYQKKFDTTAWAKMYHKALFDNVRYPKGWLFEDLPTTYRLMMKCEKIAFNDYKGYFYLLRDDSIEGSAFKIAKYESCIKIVEQIAGDYGSFTDNVKRAANCRIVSFLLHVMLMVPNNQKSIRNDLFCRIKNFRKGVVFNRCSRKKTRVAALLSYGGLCFIDFFAKYGLSRKK